MNRGDDLTLIFGHQIPGCFQVSKLESVRPCVEKMAGIFKQYLMDILNDFELFKHLCEEKQETYQRMLPSLFLQKADDYWNLGKKENAMEIHQKYKGDLSKLQMLRVNSYKKAN